MNNNHCNSSQGLTCNGTKCICNKGLIIFTVHSKTHILIVQLLFICRFWSPWHKKCIECDPANWTILSNACYHFSNHSTNRLEAEVECSRRGGKNSKLCTISTLAELDLIQTYLIEQLGSNSEQFWVILGVKTFCTILN